MNITGKRLVLCLLFLTLTAVLYSGLESSIYAQGTASLETECVAFASATSILPPPPLTAEEYCKALVAVLGEEWAKAVKLEATIIVVNGHDVRLAAAEAAIAELQSQIDAINAKLASIAAAWR